MYFSSAASSSVRTLRRRSSRPFCVSASTRGKPAGAAAGLSDLRPPFRSPPLAPGTLKYELAPERVRHRYIEPSTTDGLSTQPDSRAFSESVAAAPSPIDAAPQASEQHHASARRHQFLAC